MLVGQEIVGFNELEVTYLIYRRKTGKGSRRPINTSLIAWFLLIKETSQDPGRNPRFPKYTVLKHCTIYFF